MLSAIWLSKPETARRVRQRMRTVLDWARVAHGLSSANPVYGVETALPKQRQRSQHFAAMPYDEVRAFLGRLQRFQASEMTILALQFLILTACRTNEVLLATWSEFNLVERTWTIPAPRMKTGLAHVVPLPPRVMQLLEQAKAVGREGEELVFHSPKRRKPLSNMVFLMLLRRMQLPVTAHGFRSSFRDWAAEETRVENFVVEKALAHAIHNKVEAAYRRGDLLRKRRELMEAWATYCAGAGPQCAEEPGKEATRHQPEPGGGRLSLTPRH